MPRLLLLALVTSALALLLPRAAVACSCEQCRAGHITPITGDDMPPVPANVAALYVKRTSYDALPAAALVEADTGRPIGVTVEHPELRNTDDVLIRLAEPLAPQRTYVLEVGRNCFDPQRALDTFTIETGPVAALPSVLGRLEVEPPRTELVRTVDFSSCSVRVERTFADVRIVLSDEARPWAGALHYETQVNGERIDHFPDACEDRPPGESALGRGVDRVFYDCRFGPQVVTVQMFATLPGTDVRIPSELAQLVTACPGDEPLDPIADAGIIDSGPRAMRLLEADERCGCRSTRSGGRASSWMLWAALALFSRRFRRARR